MRLASCLVDRGPIFYEPPLPWEPAGRLVCLTCFRSLFLTPPVTISISKDAWKALGVVKRTTIADKPVSQAAYKRKPRKCTGCGEMKTMQTKALCWSCLHKRECSGCHHVKSIKTGDMCNKCLNRKKHGWPLIGPIPKQNSYGRDHFKARVVRSAVADAMIMQRDSAAPKEAAK